MPFVAANSVRLPARHDDGCSFANVNSLESLAPGPSCPGGPCAGAPSGRRAENASASVSTPGESRMMYRLACRAMRPGEANGRTVAPSWEAPRTAPTRDQLLQRRAEAGHRARQLVLATLGEDRDRVGKPVTRNCGCTHKLYIAHADTPPS